MSSSPGEMMLTGEVRTLVYQVQRDGRRWQDWQTGANWERAPRGQAGTLTVRNTEGHPQLQPTCVPCTMQVHLPPSPHQCSFLGLWISIPRQHQSTMGTAKHLRSGGTKSTTPNSNPPVSQQMHLPLSPHYCSFFISWILIPCQYQSTMGPAKVNQRSGTSEVRY